jgi:hypothetical protein
VAALVTTATSRLSGHWVDGDHVGQRVRAAGVPVMVHAFGNPDELNYSVTLAAAGYNDRRLSMEACTEQAGRRQELFDAAECERGGQDPSHHEWDTGGDFKSSRVQIHFDLNSANLIVVRLDVDVHQTRFVYDTIGVTPSAGYDDRRLSMEACTERAVHRQARFDAAECGRGGQDLSHHEWDAGRTRCLDGSDQLMYDRVASVAEKAATHNAYDGRRSTLAEAVEHMERRAARVCDTVDSDVYDRAVAAAATTAEASAARRAVLQKQLEDKEDEAEACVAETRRAVAEAETHHEVVGEEW